MKCSVLAVAGLALLVAGCKSRPVECTSSEAQGVISELISEEIGKATKEQLGDTQGTQISEAKIRATVALVKVSIHDIRTTKSDPDSTKRFCEGTLKVVMPLKIISDAEKLRRQSDFDSVDQLADVGGLSRSADTFSRTLSFAVQPTDDRKKTFGEIDEVGMMFTALGEIIASHLVLPTVEAHEQAQAVEQQAQQAQLDQQATAQKQADFELANAENKLANQAISEIWKALPSEARSRLLDLQRAWIKKKTADCNIRAAGASTDSVVRETARLRCDTELTRARSQELRQVLDAIDARHANLELSPAAAQ